MRRRAYDVVRRKNMTRPKMPPIPTMPRAMTSQMDHLSLIVSAVMRENLAGLYIYVFFYFMSGVGGGEW